MLVDVSEGDESSMISHVACNRAPDAKDKKKVSTLDLLQDVLDVVLDSEYGE
jgi:hypothetical protein